MPSSDFPTCAPIVEGECKFHANILTQVRAEQLGNRAQQGVGGGAEGRLADRRRSPPGGRDRRGFPPPLLSRGFDLYLNGHVHTLNQYTIDGGGSYVNDCAGAMVATQDQTTPAAEAKLRGGACRVRAAADGTPTRRSGTRRSRASRDDAPSPTTTRAQTQYIDADRRRRPLVHHQKGRARHRPARARRRRRRRRAAAARMVRNAGCIRPQGERAAVRRRRVRLLRTAARCRAAARLRRRGRCPSA